MEHQLLQPLWVWHHRRLMEAQPRHHLMEVGYLLHHRRLMEEDCLHLRRIPEAAAAFRRYLELNPNASDKEAIQAQLRSLGHWLASRN